jgi:hypothetical protein
MFVGLKYHTTTKQQKMNSIDIMFGSEQAQKFTDRVKAALYPATISGSEYLPQLMIIVGAGGNGKTFLMDQIRQQFSSQVCFMPTEFLTTTNDKIKLNHNIACINQDEATLKLQPEILKERLSFLQPHQLVVFLCNQMPVFTPYLEPGMYKRCIILDCINNQNDVSALKASSLQPLLEALKV